MRVSEQSVLRPTLRPLSKHEIDRRIESVWSEVALCAKARRTEAEGSEEDQLRPVWISSGELVRRMSAFLVEN